MNTTMNLTYESSLSRLRELNSSFDTGVMRIAYHGRNYNGSAISKAAFERSLDTIWNCPVVCNYDRETDTIGSHDVELVEKDGKMCLVNITQPVGVVPESATTYWETIEEADGTTHEYLCVDVLLWKRQEAYKKIIAEEKMAQSMEITVKEGELVDNVFNISRFEFTAFCLLGSAKPCFESASLELFSRSEYQQQFSEMMQDVKRTIIEAQSAPQVDITKETHSEGGDFAMEEKNALMSEFNIDPNSIDFNLEDFTLDELRAKFEEMTAEPTVTNPESAEPAAEPVTDPVENFALAEQVREGLIEAVRAEKIETEFGSMSRYYFVDFDYEKSELYVYDYQDNWKLYGMSYAMDGDAIKIDFESKKRKKYAIVDFNEGEGAEEKSVFAAVIEEVTAQHAAVKSSLADANENVASMTSELDALRQYKADTQVELNECRKAGAREMFQDLVGNEEFEALCERIGEFEKAEFEDKCYIIRGKNTVPATFSQKPEGTRLPIMKHGENNENEPYGGLFTKYAKKA